MSLLSSSSHATPGRPYLHQEKHVAVIHKLTSQPPFTHATATLLIPAQAASHKNKQKRKQTLRARRFELEPYNVSRPSIPHHLYTLGRDSPPDPRLIPIKVWEGGTLTTGLYTLLLHVSWFDEEDRE